MLTASVPVRPFSRATPWLRALAVLAALTLTACGGGGSSGTAPTQPTTPTNPGTPTTPTTPTVPTPQLPVSGTAVALTSASDNPLAKGKSYSYTQVDASIAVTHEGGTLSIKVLGDEQWTARLSLVDQASGLKPGDYPDLADTQGPHSPYGSFYLQAQTTSSLCGSPRSRVTVERVVWEGASLSEVSLSFEHTCIGVGGPLKGALRWLASDTRRGPGPVQPIPATLWAPPAGATPASGNYIYMESAAGDQVGLGRTLLHTHADTLIYPELAGPHMRFVVKGDVNWYGDIQVMDSLSRVQVGYYQNLHDHANRNPRKGGLTWHTGITGCTSSGSKSWLAVDSVRYQGDVMTQLELRFEQRCGDGVGQPLRGKLRWSIDQQTLPAGPILQVPANLWQPPTAAVPATGNFVYLEGEAGESISQGQTLLYSGSPALFSVFDKSGSLRVSVPSGEWNATFAGDVSRRLLQPGLYAGLLGAPFHNPARGGISWTGQGRGCSATGWFVVDDIAHTYGELRRIDLRFEQICAGSDKRLRGRIRWASTDPIVLENRIDPPLQPVQPPSLTPPDHGSYVVLDSGADDFIGAGRYYLFSSATSLIKVEATSRSVVVRVSGDTAWTGKFMDTTQPDNVPGPGTYPLDAAQGMPIFSGWSGDGRGCMAQRGNFTIDKITRDANGVHALDLSFEQYCDSNYTPLRGRVHWVANDLVQPPGPVYPAPSDLWRLPASQTPASGNYLFIHSAPGSFVGNGGNLLVTPTNHEFKVFAEDRGVKVVFFGDPGWGLDLQPMLPLTRLQAGYYGDLKRVISMNPARGGLDFGGNSRGCNTLSGWFVIDAVAYDGNSLSALDLRFMQLCEESGPPLHGQMRWRR
ncbi:hypothetical protein ABT392_12925 [Paucibacter sp. JuS9]|uniref:hypothetical protein n=1 Tax=Paucibacter sp. JuS9 TaxID=3228748 RepID=UPI003757F269